QRDGNFGLGGGDFPGLSASAGGRAPYAQIVATDGSVLSQFGGIILPADSSTRSIAAGQAGGTLSDVTVSGSHLRVYTFHDSANAPGGQQEPVAVELARPLAQVDNVLTHLRLILVLLFAGGIALAAALGRLGARRVLAPLGEVAHAAQHIGETEDLTSRLRVRADDEVGQLATRFNSMLDRLESSRAALDESVRAQRQLVADASHELRTPITSLRTNIEVLLAGGEPGGLGGALNIPPHPPARHSPPDGTVEVTVDQHGVRVRDHGLGVAEQDLPYVFDRFFRGTNARGRQGSGLGLAIVRQVTEQHGGHAEVVNAPQG